MQSYIQSHGGTRGPPPRPRGLPPRPRPDEFRTGRGARPRLPAVGSPRGLASAGPSLQRPRIVPSFGGRGLPPRPRSHSHQASTVPGGKGGPRPRGPPKVFRTEKRRNALQLDGLAHRHAMAVGASLDFRIKQILNNSNFFRTNMRFNGSFKNQKNLSLIDKSFKTRGGIGNLAHSRMGRFGHSSQIG